ncbi:MAG: GNAT family N-acetyltransferase [Lachnospiraceae bacterium]|nr:GNAT family N-acetyltransferase [Lachnospiraceae bacterium]
MIRKLLEKDIDRVADIWLDTNIKAHYFIPAQYWQDHFDAVKEMISQAEVYVYEDENEKRIQGFVGLSDDYIAGIFVWNEIQSCGIGKQLLDFLKSTRKQLSLSVYQKNMRAVKFYQRENFKIQCENTDDNTGEKEYFMIWKE